MKFSLMLFCFLGLSVTAGAESTGQNASGKQNGSAKNERCVPNFENGKPAGYKCFKDGAALGEGSLKKGDVISEVDGQPVGSAKKGFEALGVKQAHKITVKRSTQTAPADELHK